MNFYNTWIYQNIINAQWLIWAIVLAVFTINILSPILAWGVINSRPVLGKLKKRA